MNNPSWYLDEVEHAGFEHLDTDYVATYDQKAGEDVRIWLAWTQRAAVGDDHSGRMTGDGHPAVHREDPLLTGTGGHVDVVAGHRGASTAGRG